MAETSRKALLKRAVWIAAGVGLLVGLMLSVPLSQRFRGERDTGSDSGSSSDSNSDSSSSSNSDSDSSSSSNSDSDSDWTPPLGNPFDGLGLLAPKEVVVLGRDAGGGNTDAIFTVRVEDGRTRITQIPRDSYINAEGFGAMKINSLLARGGPEAVKAELTGLMNRPIDHHIVVKLDAIEILADLVGGIEVDVPKRLYYVDRSQGLVIDLQPGPQLLKGKQLEGFLRWRNDGRGDFGRLERQQLALQGLVERIKQPQNLVRLPALIAAAGAQLQTDLGPVQLGALITAMGASDLDMQRLKATPFSRDGISYLDTEWPSGRSSVPEASEESSQQSRFLF